MSLVPIFYVGTFVITMITTFFISLNGMFINRTFYNTPLVIFENNVLKIDEENKIYCFDYISLEDDLNTYYKANLKGKVNSYKIAFKYFDYDEENEEFNENLDNKPEAIKIRFVCQYYFNNKVDAYLSFHIETKNGGEVFKNE